MSTGTLNCIKCGSTMEKGRLSGIKWISFNSDEERKKLVGNINPLIAYRCTSCGYCELYASDKDI